MKLISRALLAVLPLILLIPFSLLLPPSLAEATHFRGAEISWLPNGGTSIQFSVTTAFRRDGYSCINPSTLGNKPCSASDGLPGEGDLIEEYIGGSIFEFGDGSSLGSPLGPLIYEVTSIDPTNNWLYGEAIDPAKLPTISTSIVHTYASTGSFVAYIDSCCRISSLDPPNAHINNPDGEYRVETLVNAGAGNSSPVSSLPPIVTCPENGMCSFQVPASDANGDQLSYRLSTSSEAGGSSGFLQPGSPYAPNQATISPSGVYTWNTSGAKVGPQGYNTLYSTQVTIQDLDSSGNVKSKIAVDFFIQLVPSVAGQPPQFTLTTPTSNTCGSRVMVAAKTNADTTTQAYKQGGTDLSFTVAASDSASGDNVTLNAVGLPSGAITVPALPATGNPVQTTFSWPSTAVTPGTYVVTFSATDSSGLQSLCSVNIAVVSDFKQYDAQWNNPPDPNADYLGGALGRAQSPPCDTLDQGGCAVSSTADVLAYYGTPQLTENYGRVNPLDLNEWLSEPTTVMVKGQPQQQPRGFSEYCYIKWDEAAAASGGYVSNAQVYTPKSYSPSQRTAAIDSALENGEPVIVGVEGDGHWIVLIGKSNGSYIIVDPVGQSGRLLSTAYPGGVSTVIVYPAGALSPLRPTLSFKGFSPVELLVTDPQGRMTGYDASTGTYLNQIPQASYGTDVGLIDDTGVSPQLPSSIDFTVVAPLDGDYTVQVIGTGAGTYQFEASYMDASGNPTSQIATGTANPGSVDVYTAQLSNGKLALAPATTALVNPTPNASGWNNSAVAVTLNATDYSGSGIRSITYSASGAQTINPTTVSGASATVNLTASGITTVSYAATDQAGNVEPTKTTTVKIDPTPPSCALTMVGTNAQGQKYIQVTTQDALSGLSTVTITGLTNATASVGSYQSGITSAPTTVQIPDNTTNPVVVTATKVDQSQGSELALQLTDVAGNVTNCDPVFTDLGSQNGKPGWQVSTDLSPAEHVVTVQNGNPGLNRVRVIVNRTAFDLTGLKNGEVRTLDVAKAMHPGDTNVVILHGIGTKGASAEVLIWDGNGRPSAPTDPARAHRGKLGAGDGSGRLAADALLDWLTGSAAASATASGSGG